jgi:plasmid stability protein
MTTHMAMTTIRVEAEVRDRLAARAEANGRSLGAELQAMLDEMMWQGIEAGYRRLAANRDEMAAYRAETAEWTSVGLGDLAATAAGEFPEYNSLTSGDVRLCDLNASDRLPRLAGCRSAPRFRDKEAV